MTQTPAVGYAAVNVLLDAVVAYDPESPTPEPIDLALERLAEVDGAYEVKVNDDDGGDLDVQLDLSNLVGGTLVAFHWLIAQVAEATSTSSEVVISDLRSFLADL